MQAEGTAVGTGASRRIGPGGALGPGPARVLFSGPYPSSRPAVSAIGESPRAELAPLGIRVLEIMPGPIDTDMLAGSDRPPEAIEFDDYRAIAQRYYEGRSAIDAQITST